MCGCSFELRGYHLTVTHASLGFFSPTSSSLSRLSVPTHDLSGCYTRVHSSPSPSLCSRTLETNTSVARLGNMANSQCVLKKDFSSCLIITTLELCRIFRMRCRRVLHCLFALLWRLLLSWRAFAARRGNSFKVSWVNHLIC